MLPRSRPAPSLPQLPKCAGKAADAIHAHELWIIAGDNPPVSLGVLRDNGMTLSLPSVTLSAVLAIPIEQASGSPNGKPTSAFVALGKLTGA